MDEEQLKRFRTWHKHNFAILTKNELVQCLILINLMFDVEFDFGSRGEQTKEAYGSKVYLNDDIISSI